jgi:hypothetical protein
MTECPGLDELERALASGDADVRDTCACASVTRLTCI